MFDEQRGHGDQHGHGGHGGKHGYERGGHGRRKGFLLAFVPVDQFTLLRGEEELKSYLFNKHRIEHRFCTTCGTQPFAYGRMPDGAEIRAINLRCVEAVDLDALTVKKIDGASF